MAGEAYGFSPTGYNQIIVYNSEEDFKEALESNPNMTAIMGVDRYTQKHYPGVFIAGVKADFLPEEIDRMLREALSVVFPVKPDVILPE